MPKPDQIELDLGAQPLDGLMRTHEFSNHDLVAASTEQLSHKMVARGRKGRRLKRKAQEKILRAFNAKFSATDPDPERTFSLPDLFNYKGLF